MRLTLQGVANGKDVHEDSLQGAPCKESKTPRQAQQECQADDSLQVKEEFLAPVLPGPGIVGFHDTDLTKDSNEHANVDQEYQDEIAN